MKISSYIPFTCEFYFNGHHALKLKLDQAKIFYKMQGNAFTEISDIDRFTRIVKGLTGQVVGDRISYWLDRYFRFDKGKYSIRSKYLVHDWYMCQVEVCSNVIFKSSRYCRNLFERLLDKFRSVGSPDSLIELFEQHRARKKKMKSSIKLYENNACAKVWFRGNSIKLYNKLRYYLRVETTINAPKLLGSFQLKKSLAYLQAYLWYGIGSNDRYYNCYADVDVSSICDEQIDRYTQSVLDAKDRPVSAPDLRKARQLSLFEELLKPKYSVFDFRTTELFMYLADNFSNSAQIRYELRKLIVRGIIEKRQHTNYYRVTKLGWQWLWLSILPNKKFVSPMISIASKNANSKNMEQATEMERGQNLLNKGLAIVINELRIAA